MRKVWVVSNSGNIRDEVFDTDEQASNFAKQQSGISAVMCAIYQSGKKAFFYENGKSCDAARRRDLTKAVEEIILYQMSKEASQGKKSFSK